MKTLTKALLLSALVLPGAGHLFLKKYIPGVALMSAFSVALYLLMEDVVNKAEQMVQQIQTGQVDLEITSVTELLANQSVGMNEQTLTLISFSIGLIWLVGLIDTYRIGRDKNS